MKIFASFLLAAGLLMAGEIFAADEMSGAPLRKIAIIVENRAGAQFNDKVPVLEDLVASRIAGKGYSVISRDVAVNALKSYSTAGVNVSSQSSLNASAGASSSQNSTATGAAKLDTAQISASQQQSQMSSGNASASLDAARSDSAQVATTPEATKLDQLLNDNISALRLAQTLGADYILIPAITSYGTERKSYNADGIATVNTIYKLRASYKIVEAGEGGAVRGGTVLAEKTYRDTGNLKTDSSDVINELLDDAADQLADAIAANAKALPTDVAQTALVTFSVACTMNDPRQQPIFISTPGMTDDQRAIMTNQPVAVQPTDVTVELDGVAIGSAPGTFQARPGLHKLRLSRGGFGGWERTVNIYNGQTLRVALQMDPEDYARWAEMTGFMATLENNRKLTDAEVQKIEGLAKFYSESHYRVDTKDNVQIHKSLY
jgi:hypothetical protein